MVDKIEIINGVIKWTDLEGSILSYVILRDNFKIRILKFDLGYNVEDYEEVIDYIGNSGSACYRCPFRSTYL